MGPSVLVMIGVEEKIVITRAMQDMNNVHDVPNDLIENEVITIDPSS